MVILHIKVVAGLVSIGWGEVAEMVVEIVVIEVIEVIYKKGIRMRKKKKQKKQ